MDLMFGEELKRFALSIDTVDNEIGKQFYYLLVEYLQNILKMKHFHFMIDSGTFEGNQSLQVPEIDRVFWSSENKLDAVRIRSEGENSTYMAQSTYVYDTGKPIWVTADGKSLNLAEEYKDDWSNSVNLPNYYADEKADVLTSIVVPLKTRYRTFGFMCLESSEELKCYDLAKIEVERVAEAAGAVLSARDICNEQHQNTYAALTELKILAGEPWQSPFYHPKIFIASAENAADDVMGVILATTNKFASKLEVVYWKDIQESGDITKIIRKYISECRFGICYFSQRSKDLNDDPNIFYDNPNVLFEAGMMQALTGSPIGQPKAWIPIRESDSVPKKIPFDFAQENVIFINRLAGGKLNAPELKKDLCARIEVITKDITKIEH
jgi:hypothetical protein